MSETSITPRVQRFCDWLDTIPPKPLFHTRPEFRFFRDLTDDEIAQAAIEMRRRAAPLAAALVTQGEKRKAVVLQRDEDGQFAIRFAEPVDARECAVEKRFADWAEADRYGRELTRTWGNVFGPLVDQSGGGA